MKFVYLHHDFATGWPAEKDLFYECQKCGEFISSIHDGQCKCGNVYVDTGYGRAGAKNILKVRLVKKPNHR